MYSHPCSETVCYSCQQKQHYSQLSLFCGQPVWHRQVVPWIRWNPSGFWFIAEHSLHEWSYAEWSYTAFSRRNIAVPRAETEQFCPNKPELASLGASVGGSALSTRLKRTGCGDQNASGKSPPDKTRAHALMCSITLDNLSWLPAATPGCLSNMLPTITYCMCITSISLFVGSSQTSTITDNEEPAVFKK